LHHNSYFIHQFIEVNVATRTLMNHFKSLYSKTKQSFPFFFLGKKELYTLLILATIDPPPKQYLSGIRLYRFISPDITLQRLFRFFFAAGATGSQWCRHSL